MKGFHLKFKTYSDALALSHGFGTLQNVIYIQEKGIIGKDKKYFFTANPESMAKCKQIVGEKNNHFIGEIELDDNHVEEIIILGKNYNSMKDEFDNKAKSLLEIILKSDEEKLGIPEIPEEQIQPIDISALDSKTIPRLERIVDSCENNYIKAEFYKKTGNLKKVAEQGKKLERYEETHFQFGSDHVFSRLELSEKYNFDEKEQKRRAKKAYEFAIKREKYDKAIDIGKRFLNIPESEIIRLRKNKLYGDIIANWVDDEENGLSYLEILAESAEDLSKDDTKEVAISAYEHLINKKDSFESRKTLFRAAQLVKFYNLGKDKFTESIKRLLEAHLNVNLVGGYKELQKAIKEFELSDEIVKPVILDYFKCELYHYGNEAEVIRRRHNLSDEEIKPIVQDAYDKSLKSGSFGIAHRLRSGYSCIKSEQVSLEDLRILSRII